MLEQGRVPQGEQSRHRLHIPMVMLAAAIDRFADPGLLVMHALDVLKGDTGDVLIALETARTGLWDADVCAGWHPGRKNPCSPLVLSTDGAGIVAYPHGVAPLPNEQRGITFAASGGISGVREFQRFNRAVEAAKREVCIAESLPLSDLDKVREQHLEARGPRNFMFRILEV